MVGVLRGFVRVAVLGRNSLIRSQVRVSRVLRVLWVRAEWVVGDSQLVFAIHVRPTSI